MAKKYLPFGWHIPYKNRLLEIYTAENNQFQKTEILTCPIFRMSVRRNIRKVYISSFTTEFEKNGSEYIRTSGNITRNPVTGSMKVIVFSFSEKANVTSANDRSAAYGRNKTERIFSVRRNPYRLNHTNI